MNLQRNDDLSTPRRRWQACWSMARRMLRPPKRTAFHAPRWPFHPLCAESEFTHAAQRRGLPAEMISLACEIGPHRKMEVESWDPLLREGMRKFERDLKRRELRRAKREARNTIFGPPSRVHVYGGVHAGRWLAA